MRAALILASLLLGLLAGLPLAAQASTAVSLQLKWRHAFQFAGYYAAVQQGYYREAGLEVDIRPGSPDVNPVTEVTSGRATFGVGTSSLVLSRAANQPVRVLGVVLQHSPQILVARADLPIQSIHDLVGQPIMLEPQSEELLAYLQQENIPRNKLQLQAHSGSINELLSGKVMAMSAYSSYEPFLLTQNGAPFYQYTPRQAGIDFYGDNLFTSDQVVHSQPDMVQAFRQASFRGWEYALAHPDATIDLILKEYAPDLPRAFLEFEAAHITRLVQPDLIEVGYMAPGRWQHIADTYASLGVIDPDFDVQQLLLPDLHDQQLQRVRQALNDTLAGSVLISLLSLVVIAYIYRTNRQLRRAQTQLQRSEHRYRILTEEMRDVIWAIDVQTLRYSYISPSVQRLRGYTAHEVMQAGDLRHSMPPVSVQAVQSILQNAQAQWDAGSLNSDHYFTLELEQHHKQGHLIWTEIVGHLVLNPDNQRLELQGITRDISAHKRQQAHIEYMAQHDVLTGLANRALFAEHFQQARALARRNQYLMALIYIDLDKFKPVNDTYGHDIGDQLLCAVGQRISACIRSSDIVARIGGDEFVVLLNQVRDAACAVLVAEKIHAALRTPFEIAEYSLEISSSQGVALYPEHGNTEAELAKCADLAMYQAKNAGRNQVCLYTPNLSSK